MRHTQSSNALLTAKQKGSLENNAVHLKDDDPKALDAQLRHMYHFGYFDADGETTALLLIDRIYQVTDKYDVPSLRVLAAQKFEGFRKSASVNDEVLVETACAVYEYITPANRTLRDDLLEAAVPNIDRLLNSEKLTSVLKDLSVFNVELLRWLARKKPPACRQRVGSY